MKKSKLIVKMYEDIIFWSILYIRLKVKTYLDQSELCKAF